MGTSGGRCAFCVHPCPRGTLTEADRTARVVVGVQRAIPVGVAERLGADLAWCGLMVVSDLAQGIDATAYYGALTAGGMLPVLGDGPGCGLST